MSEGQETRRFEVGQRVRVVGHWEFVDGIVGTIAEPESFHFALAGLGEWQGHRRVHKACKGMIVSYYVIFDEPADDGSGDGPYTGAEIESDSLEPISA